MEQMETSMEQMFNKALKDILQLPRGTPIPMLVGESLFQPINLIIEKKRIMQSKGIKKMDNYLVGR